MWSLDGPGVKESGGPLHQIQGFVLFPSATIHAQKGPSIFSKSQSLIPSGSERKTLYATSMPATNFVPLYIICGNNQLRYSYIHSIHTLTLCGGRVRWSSGGGDISVVGGHSLPWPYTTLAYKLHNVVNVCKD